MTPQPATIHKPGKGYFPARRTASGRLIAVSENGFHYEANALAFAEKSCRNGWYKQKPKKVDVNLSTKPFKMPPPPPKPVRTTPDSVFDHHDRTKPLPHVPTTFASEGHDPPWFGEGIQYETPDVHKTDESHGSLDHLGAPGALPDQTPANVTAVELCRLFNVDRNLMQQQAKPTVELDAWEEGRLAAQGGKGKRSCPYVKGGIVYYDWMDGFNSHNAGDML